jgi:hypothetical protein
MKLQIKTAFTQINLSFSQIKAAFPQINDHFPQIKPYQVQKPSHKTCRNLVELFNQVFLGLLKNAAK